MKTSEVITYGLIGLAVITLIKKKGATAPIQAFKSAGSSPFGNQQQLTNAPTNLLTQTSGAIQNIINAFKGKSIPAGPIQVADPIQTEIQNLDTGTDTLQLTLPVDTPQLMIANMPSFAAMADSGYMS